MDAVVGNKYLDLLNNLDIEVSKKLEGEYEVDEIINAFKNFFFNRMFLDITAIKNYKDVSNLQKLSMSLDMNKVIFLLDKDDSISESNGFLSKLVNMGIYNFTSDGNALMYLYNNPNVYRDVSHYQDVNNNVIKKSIPITIPVTRLAVVSNPINFVNIPIKSGNAPSINITNDANNQNKEYLIGILFLDNNPRIIITKTIANDIKTILRLLLILTTFFHKYYCKYYIYHIVYIFMCSYR